MTSSVSGAIDPRVDEDAMTFRSRLDLADLSDFRVGLCDWYFEDCDSGVAEAVETALDELAEAGLRISSVEMPHFDDVTDIFNAGGLHAGEFAAFINDEMRDYKMISIRPSRSGSRKPQVTPWSDISTG